MTDRKLMQQCYAVPLHEQLSSVPVGARLVIDDPDGMGTCYIPVGRLCHEAAAAITALREALEQPKSMTPSELAERIKRGEKWALEQPQESTHSADCYKWHHECAKAEVERLRKRNPWKDAIDHELVQIESTADSYDDPAKALNDLIHWHVCVATDPKVNGGFALVPVEAESALKRMADNARELGLDYEAKNPLGGPAKIFDAMADSIRAGDDYHATLKRFGYAEQISSEPLANPAANHAETFGSPLECPECHGKGYTDEGDPEVGSAIFECESCKGRPQPMAWIYDWFADDEIEGERVIHDWVTTDYDEAHCSTNGCHNIRPLYTHPPRREWASLIRGVRVEGDSVVVLVKGGNENARLLCSELLREKNA